MRETEGARNGSPEDGFSKNRYKCGSHSGSLMATAEELEAASPKIVISRNSNPSK
jgi:hypothetical protein